MTCHSRKTIKRTSNDIYGLDWIGQELSERLRIGTAQHSKIDGNAVCAANENEVIKQPTAAATCCMVRVNQVILKSTPNDTQTRFYGVHACVGP